MTDTPTPKPAARPWARRTAVVVVLLFLLAALPLAIWQFTSNSDEPRYSVAAARMMATGDYIIPVAAWGEVRLLKPPLTYYYIVAGFMLFGQSVIGAKALWLVSSGLVLWLTWALSRAIGASRAGSAVAVAALAGNILFYRATLTHNPDIPMVLGLTAALLGLVRILSAGRPPVWSYAALWLGAAFAFQAKGLLAVLLVALALVVRFAAGARGRPRRAEWVSGVLALVLALWWHVVVAIREPAALWAQFVGDQVTGKAEFAAARVLGGLGYDLFFLVIGFLPILLVGVPMRFRDPRRLPPALLALALWCVLVVVVFAFSNYLSERYMLPAMPVVAAFIGLAMSRMGTDALAHRAGRAVRILLVLPLAVGLVSAGIVYARSVAAGLAVLVAVLAAVWGVWLLAGLGRPGLALVLIGLLAPVTVLSTWPAYRLLAYPTAADIAVRDITAMGVPAGRIVVIRRWHLLERIGLQVPPIEEYRFAPRVDRAVLDGADLVVAYTPEDGRALEDLGFDVTEKRGAPEDFGPGDLLSAIAARDLEAFRAEFGETLFLATPRPAGG